MAIKTQISETTFQQIIPKYKLGDFIASDPIPQGTVQTNYLIHTTQGNFIFRYYENRARESVLFETGLLRYLKQQDYPCPGPFPKVDGDFVGSFQGKPYVIFEFLGG